MSESTRSASDEPAFRYTAAMACDIEAPGNDIEIQRDIARLRSDGRRIVCQRRSRRKGKHDDARLREQLAAWRHGILPFNDARKPAIIDTV